MNPNRIALTFDRTHITAAQADDAPDHIATALDYLKQTDDASPVVQAYKLALRYRFMDDAQSGNQVVEMIQQAQLHGADAVRQALAWLNVVEMVRDLVPWESIEATELMQAICAMLGDRDLSLAHDVLEHFWFGALQIGAGIVLNDVTLFEQGQAVYQMAIEQHIHPEGYFKGLVDVEEAMDTYHKQVSATTALVLMAEMAAYAGVDLWSIDNRGVTPLTATSYTLYYYYYPERWRWEDGLTLDAVKAIMENEGAFIEICNRRNPLQAIEHLFEDLRPMFSVHAGGLTTLTHGTPAPRKKRRWSLF